MISLDNLSIVLALSSIGLSLHVLRAIWQLWRAGGISLLIAATACLILFWNDRS